MSGKERTMIPIHTHCRVCGKSIPWGKDYCSSECREKELKFQKRTKRTNRFFILFFVMLIITMLILSLLSTPR
ncbi:MAG: DUF2116 family Zn-ribbon domain-containing protein [Nitrososphaerales archaeon]